jgi:hypothetical protein
MDSKKQGGFAAVAVGTMDLHSFVANLPSFSQKIGPECFGVFQAEFGGMMEICLNPSLFRQIMPILLDEEWGERDGGFWRKFSRAFASWGKNKKRGFLFFFVL